MPLALAQLLEAIKPFVAEKEAEAELYGDLRTATPTGRPSLPGLQLRLYWPTIAPAAVVGIAPAPPAFEQPQPWVPPIWQALERCTVVELRRLARAEGLPRSLSRAGRRAELLPALAGAAMAW